MKTPGRPAGPAGVITESECVHQIGRLVLVVEVFFDNLSRSGHVVVAFERLVRELRGMDIGEADFGVFLPPGVYRSAVFVNLRQFVSRLVGSSENEFGTEFHFELVDHISGRQIVRPQNLVAEAQQEDVAFLDDVAFAFK